MSKRIRTSAVLLLVCALVLIFLSSRVWVSVIFAELNSPTLVLPITGRAIDPLGAGCGWALVASVLAFAVSRGPIRRLVGAAMVLLSGTALVSAWNSHGDSIANQVNTLTSQAVGRTVVDANFTSNYLWIVALLSSGACLLAGLILLTSPKSTTKPSRYDRTKNPAELSPWQAIDAGLDPTQD